MIPDINLMPKVDKRQSTPKNLYIIVSIVSLLLFAFLVIQYFKYRAEVTDLKSEEQQVLAEQAKWQAKLDGASLNTGSLKQSVEFVEAISYPVSPIIDETIRLQFDHTYLREYVFDEEALEMSMDFETLGDISKYLTRLSNSSYFSDVQVSSIEHFDVETKEDDEEDFNEMPRYEAKFVLSINQNALAAGGAKK